MLELIGWAAFSVSFWLAARELGAALRGLGANFEAGCRELREAGEAQADAARYAARSAAGRVRVRVRPPAPEDARMAPFRAWASGMLCTVRNPEEMSHLEACWAMASGVDDAEPEAREEARRTLAEYGLTVQSPA